MYDTLSCRVNPADLIVEEWDSDHPRYQEAVQDMIGSLRYGAEVRVLVALDDAGMLLGALTLGTRPCPLAACPEAVIMGVTAPCGTDLGTALYEEAALLARSMGCARLLVPAEAGVGLGDALRLGLDPCHEIEMVGYALTLDSDLLPVMEWADEVDGYVL